METIKQYICICGKKFDNSQSFNGHKSNCIDHLLQSGKIKSKEDWLIKKASQGKNSAKTRKTNYEANKALLLLKWVEEQHVCEKCGKVMTEKFGSGRFCSRACANSRIVTDTHRQKTSASLKNINRIARITNTTINSSVQRHIKAKHAYDQNPHCCAICKVVLPYNKRYRKLCGNATCQSIYLSQALTKAHAEGRHPNFKYHNEESYPEKYFKQVLINHNIPFKTQVPVFNGKNYFHLDFELCDKIDLEIDGRLHDDAPQIAHDKWRDEVVISQGYKVYRFKWINPKKEQQMQLKIKEFLDWYYENSGVV